MSGTQLSDMTAVAVDDAPDEAQIPWVVESATGGFSPVSNYRSDIIGGLNARVKTADLGSTASDEGAALVGTPYDLTVATALGRRVTLANTKASMTARTKASLASGQMLQTAGAVTPEDGGGTLYRWDPAATDPPNTGTILPSDEGGAGRWKVVGVDGINAGTFGVYESGITNTVRKTRIQLAIDASYGKRLVFTHSGMLEYQSDTGADLTVSVPSLVTSGGLIIEGTANNAQFGPGLKNTGNGHGLKADNQTGNNYNGAFVIRRLSLFGDGTDASGGSGIYLYRMNAETLLEDVWLDGHRENAVYAEDCYGMNIVRGIYNNSRKSNIKFKNAANNIKLDSVRSYAAGRIYAGEFANIEFDCASGTGFGTILQNCDVSYSGSAPFATWTRSAGTLVNIVVLSNVATVKTSTPHGLSNGDKPVITGATVDAGLNSKYALGITVVDADEFTIPFTAAANGTYTEVTLAIVPPSHGFWSNQTPGLTISALYCEDPALTGAFLTGAATGMSYIGGDMLDALVLVDGPTIGQIGPFNAHGVKAGVYMASSNRHEMNVAGVALSAGATLTGCTMRDGRYQGTAMPTSGTWVAGDRFWNNAFTVDGNNMILRAWDRLTSGSGNVLNTDWVGAYSSTVSPAT